MMMMMMLFHLTQQSDPVHLPNLVPSREKGKRSFCSKGRRGRGYGGCRSVPTRIGRCQPGVPPRSQPWEPEPSAREQACQRQGLIEELSIRLFQSSFIDRGHSRASLCHVPIGENEGKEKKAERAARGRQEGGGEWELGQCTAETIENGASTRE